MNLRVTSDTSVVKKTPPHLLFVYGTLLQPGNEFADYLNQHCKFITRGKLKGILYDIGEYPGLILNDTTGYVFGNIYQIDKEDVLKELDIYEGVGPDEEQPNLYLRLSLPIETDSGSMQAWVYVYNRPIDRLPVIASGNYAEYLKFKA
ncbi:gamma-glutamylcyclotransferase family protein [Mucilaginibacter pedocola]|uniref:Gamma-glutamylcyclotransferase AIG2-like domain-containing protein n=1 Tax=Mucilaginibacter pedocola TaxID=1792845 RepID=A0A1S9PLL0_9SPHI|nr:gamma-glutamylcyclotransferase family protein [Mucilaginibacter pedocola]OOQ61825.1 hypothetical protein BC343_01795 [Mucilaginibacter pedocola]